MPSLMRGASNLGVFTCHRGIAHFTGPDLARGDGQCHGTAAGARTREMQPSRHSKDNKRSGKQHNFHPHRFVGIWSNGPSTVAFLKHVYARATTAGKSKMTQQSEVKYTWTTMAVSSFWDMRLSVACTATNAEFQNRIIIRDLPSSP